MARTVRKPRYFEKWELFQSSLPPGLEVCMGVHTKMPSLERTEEKEVCSGTDCYTIIAEPRCTLISIYIIFICTWVYMFKYEYIYSIYSYIFVCVIFLEVCQHDFWGPIFQWKEMKSYLTQESRCFYCVKLFMHIFRAQPKSCKDLNPSVYT